MSKRRHNWTPARINVHCRGGKESLVKGTPVCERAIAIPVQLQPAVSHVMPVINVVYGFKGMPILITYFVPVLKKDACFNSAVTFRQPGRNRGETQAAHEICEWRRGGPPHPNLWDAFGFQKNDLDVK